MICTRCEGSGLLNIDQFDEVHAQLNLDADADPEDIVAAIARFPYVEHDIAVCDCCGDGEGWHGVPGEHYGPDDPRGPNGPYAYNGGLCGCH